MEKIIRVISSPVIITGIFLLLLCHFCNAQNAITGLEANMVLVQGGNFTMGCTPEQGSDCGVTESPAHQVTVSSFYINKYDVTVKDFELFIHETNYQTDADTGGGSYIFDGNTLIMKAGVNWLCNAAGKPWPEDEKNNPVVNISWNDAEAYCRWLSSKTHKNYRLPTEAEWEYAARGGNKSKGYEYAGSNVAGDVAWSKENGGACTHPVGQKLPNELGLYDMSGNVWQRCSDWWDSEYYVNSPVDNPRGPNSGTFRAVRGGSWHSVTSNCRVACRNTSPPFPYQRSSNAGFRVVRDF